MNNIKNNNINKKENSILQYKIVYKNNNSNTIL